MSNRTIEKTGQDALQLQSTERLYRKIFELLRENDDLRQRVEQLEEILMTLLEEPE